jgi:outer membrane protein OmpA-like peptidoglycan-associated protein
MKLRSCLVALALAVMATPAIAVGDLMTSLRKTVVTADVSLAMPVGAPLADRFGLGAMPALSAAVPIEPWVLLGLRLRGGVLSNGPAPSDPTLKDPGIGGLGALLLTARLRIPAKEGEALATGPWLDVGAGPGLTGSLVRAVGEAGLGWDFPMWGFALGPTARYLHVLQPSDALDSTDAKILLFGIEIALRDVHPQPPPAEPPPPPLASASASTPPQDRDGDGIADDVDKCPDDPEDKDGFEDEDGCPDPDNDQDGIADAKDACPNDPETVNGFQDEDGCPDEGPVVVKKDRILLKEHVLFDTNRARVKAEGFPALNAVLQLWRQHPEWDHLIVDGHADRHGPDKYNVWLSRERAERVRSKLVEMGIPGAKLTLRAFGRRQPRVPEETAEADRENRRVEFVIVKKIGEPGQAANVAPAYVPGAAPAQDDASAQAASTMPPQEDAAALEPPAQAAAPLEPPPQVPEGEEENVP